MRCDAMLLFSQGHHVYDQLAELLCRTGDEQAASAAGSCANGLRRHRKLRERVRAAGTAHFWTASSRIAYCSKLNLYVARTAGQTTSSITSAAASNLTISSVKPQAPGASAAANAAAIADLDPYDDVGSDPGEDGNRTDSDYESSDDELLVPPPPPPFPFPFESVGHYSMSAWICMPKHLQFSFTI